MCKLKLSTRAPRIAADGRRNGIARGERQRQTEPLGITKFHSQVGGDELGQEIEKELPTLQEEPREV